jgi:hypothetical protein
VAVGLGVLLGIGVREAVSVTVGVNKGVGLGVTVTGTSTVCSTRATLVTICVSKTIVTAGVDVGRAARVCTTAFEMTDGLGAQLVIRVQIKKANGLVFMASSLFCSGLANTRAEVCNRQPLLASASLRACGCPGIELSACGLKF